MNFRNNLTALPSHGSDEAEAGVDFIRRYREAEALERDNNIPLTTDRVHRLETAGGFDQTMEAQKLRNCAGRFCREFLPRFQPNSTRLH
jgi:glycine/D-amino acid oxidase-like deaminating enzyme